MYAWNCIVLEVVHEALVIWEEASTEQRLTRRGIKIGWRAWPLSCRTIRRAWLFPLVGRLPGLPVTLSSLGSCLGGGAAWGGRTWRPRVHGRSVARWRLHWNWVAVAEVELGPGRVDRRWRCQSRQRAEDAPIWAGVFFQHCIDTTIPIKGTVSSLQPTFLD
jgi:hypothetical protein